jgi:hypothetical protein
MAGRNRPDGDVVDELRRAAAGRPAAACDRDRREYREHVTEPVDVHDERAEVEDIR